MSDFVAVRNQEIADHIVVDDVVYALDAREYVEIDEEDGGEVPRFELRAFLDDDDHPYAVWLCVDRRAENYVALAMEEIRDELAEQHAFFLRMAARLKKGSVG